MHPSLFSEAIGFDLDGTIDESPGFFKILAGLWPGRVYIITYCRDRQKAVDRLAEFGIKYYELVLVDEFEDKAKVIAEHDIKVYFDDQDEMLKEIAPEVIVFKVRNGGNFDFDRKLWLFSEQTGRML